MALSFCHYSVSRSCSAVCSRSRNSRPYVRRGSKSKISRQLALSPISTPQGAPVPALDPVIENFCGDAPYLPVSIVVVVVRAVFVAVVPVIAIAMRVAIVIAVAVTVVARAIIRVRVAVDPGTIVAVVVAAHAVTIIAVAIASRSVVVRGCRHDAGAERAKRNRRAQCPGPQFA